MRPKVAVRNDALVSAKNTLPVISEVAVPIARKVITIIPTGWSLRDLTQTRTLLIAGESPLATRAHSVETPWPVSRKNTITGIATSKTRVGSTCLKLKRPAGSGLIANGSTIRDFSLGSRAASPRGDEHEADARPRGRADQHLEIVPLAQRFRRFHAPPRTRYTIKSWPAKWRALHGDTSTDPSFNESKTTEPPTEARQ